MRWPHTTTVLCSTLLRTSKMESSLIEFGHAKGFNEIQTAQLQAIFFHHKLNNYHAGLLTSRLPRLVFMDSLSAASSTMFAVWVKGVIPLPRHVMFAFLFSKLQCGLQSCFILQPRKMTSRFSGFSGFSQTLGLPNVKLGPNQCVLPASKVIWIDV